MLNILSRIANQISSLPSNIVDALRRGYQNMYPPNIPNSPSELGEIINQLKNPNDIGKSETESELEEPEPEPEPEQEPELESRPISFGENKNAPKESLLVFDKVEELSIEIAEYSPIGGGHHIPLPDSMPKRNNGVINIKNNDNFCFGWCVLGVLHPIKIHPERNPHRLYEKYLNEINMKDIPIPVPVSTMVYKKFEENNPEISLCIYEWDNVNKCLDFRYLSERMYGDYKEINLLVINNEDYAHYCIIRDLNKLVYNHSKHKEQKHLCRFCLHVYSSKRGLSEHLSKQQCAGVNNSLQRPKVPIEEKSIKSFQNFKCMQASPYRIIWDLECLTEKLTPEENATLTNTEKIQRHKPCGYSYVVVRMDSFSNYEVISHDLYRGENALEKFVDALQKEQKEIQEDLSEPAQLIMKPGDYKQYKSSNTCWICKNTFPNQEKLKIMVCNPNNGNYEGAAHRKCKYENTIIGPKWYNQPSINDYKTYKEAKNCMYCNEILFDSGLLKVRDHCHISGYYRGAAHASCNSKLQISTTKTKIPLICHNFRGYDSHLLIEVVARFTAEKIRCIPENIGKYKALDVGQFRFLDSYQHMSMPLDMLVSCLGNKQKKFPLTVTHFTKKGYSLDQIKLLFRKGVFPYDWMNDWKKFEYKQLPRRKDFYSLLNQQNISIDDYKYAQIIWKKFNIKTFGQYHDLYLETDVLLLADVFMNYTIMCLKDDGLDPSHYVSAPGMFNDSLYKSTSAEIKLITDLDQYNLVEKGIRGGMCMASHRYAKANNPKCPDYDERKPKSWILDEDMNALYSGAMTQYLPTEILGNVPLKDVPEIQSIPSDGEIGYLFEVDLDVPKHLHDYFADYPLAPEKNVVPQDWLSPYNDKLLHDKDIGGGKYVLSEKLLQTLLPKRNYIIHYRALQIYLKLGIRLTKIHSVLKFKQSPWMKPFIEENIRKRKIAKANGDEFGVMYYKLKNNAVFGKQMENVRKHMRVELIYPNQDKKLKRLIASPLFVGFRTFNGGIIAVHMLKSQITLNKPMFIGQAILDISKAMMFNFWYGYIKQKYGSKAKLLYTDTDGMLMNIETEDVYKDCEERPDLFDLKYTSDLFLMKDECKGTPIAEVVALRAKMYSILPVGHDPKTPEKPEKELEEEDMKKSQGIKEWQKKHGIQKAKGVKRSTIKRELRHDKFRECLETKKLTKHKMYGLRSYNHEIYLEKVNKIGLNPYDNKRWILLDGIQTLPYGHWRITEFEKFIKQGYSEIDAENKAMLINIK